MNTRAIAMTVAFAAVTVVLNPAFSGLAVPAPFLPYLSYYIWEIPIVAAFFLIGPKHGVIIIFLNTAVLLAVFPGHPFIHPLGSLISGTSMLVGAYFGYKFLTRKVPEEKTLLGNKLVTYSTAFGILSRVVVMTFVNYVLLHYASESLLGFELSEPAIIAILPLVVLFNVTITLYTIPIGCFIARIVSRTPKL
jgi:riboflavin transporter FmnP